MALVYFGGCRDLDEAHKRFRQLSKKHHPDVGGDLEVYAAIDAEYTILKNNPGFLTQCSDEDLMFVSAAYAEKIVQWLNSRYPDVPVNSCFTGILNQCRVELGSDIDLSLMVEIEAYLKKILSPTMTLYLSFDGGRKSLPRYWYVPEEYVDEIQMRSPSYQLETHGTITFIGLYPKEIAAFNLGPDDTLNTIALLELMKAYPRRYSWRQTLNHDHTYFSRARSKYRIYA